jgi:WD40 repeat protein
MLIAALLLASTPASARSLELVATTALGTPVPEHADRRIGWNGHVDYVQWVGDKIVCGGSSGFLRCYDPATKREAWSAQLDGEVGCLSVAAEKDRIFVLIRPREVLGDNVIQELRASDGQQLRSISTDSLRRQSKRSRLAPNRLAWIPLADQLFVTLHAEKYDENGMLLDVGTLRKTATIKCDGFVTEIAAAKGQYIVTLSSRNNIRIWDVQAGKEAFRFGNDEEVEVDVPFISNAMFDGERTLVYTVDDSWATGTVYVHDIVDKRQLARFDSRNGHVVMDIDVRRGRIALTGTERGLTVVDLRGAVLADKERVALQRNVSIAYSADGNRLAIGSWDNTVRVFELKEQ